ncbi:MAG: hypothetical protein EGR89_03430, partial [[Eubacterium] rectale]|nr:hypothetical protein [Agathobacter rectalis]
MQEALYRHLCVQSVTVLEIGAGMGALTGCLCDRCGEVVAIEES